MTVPAPRSAGASRWSLVGQRRGATGETMGERHDRIVEEIDGLLMRIDAALGDLPGGKTCR